MNIDFKVYPNSRIMKLPRILQFPALLVRNIKNGFWKKRNDPRSYAHQADGMATMHNASFMKDPLFVASYQRAVKSGGFDYYIPWRIHQAIWAASVALEVPGDFIEMGTGRGFVMSAVLTSISDWAERDKHLYLFDTFSSFSTDRITGRQDTSGNVSPYYALSRETTEQNFSEWPRVHLIEGRIPQTLNNVSIDSVSFMHIDLNHHEAEVSGIKYFWPKMSEGGLILLDDYAYAGFERQYAAINSLADELGVKVLSTPTGQGLMIKQRL